MACSPRRSGLIVTVTDVMPKHHRQLDASVEASGPHAFAVRETVVRLSTARVHRTPCPTFRDDREAPLLIGLGWREVLAVICPTPKGEYFWRKGWTGFRNAKVICPSGRSSCRQTCTKDLQHSEFGLLPPLGNPRDSDLLGWPALGAPAPENTRPEKWLEVPLRGAVLCDPMALPSRPFLPLTSRFCATSYARFRIVNAATWHQSWRKRKPLLLRRPR
jgi:hypothetical protein